jgi:hypothetical protein
MYECALLKNKIDKTPVVPIFLAEKIQNKSDGVDASSFDFVPVNSRTEFPHQYHSRSISGQYMVDELAYPPAYFMCMCLCMSVYLSRRCAHGELAGVLFIFFFLHFLCYETISANKMNGEYVPNSIFFFVLQKCIKNIINIKQN